MESDLLKQLQNSLILYQENQETLDAVIQNAQAALGDDWMKLLPYAFDNTDIDEQTKETLKERANHAINYHSGLLAWEEAYSYLNEPSSITPAELGKRLPILEYWLNLFGDEGVNLLQKVKDLYLEKAMGTPKEATTEQSAENTAEQEESVMPRTQQEEIEEISAKQEEIEDAIVKLQESIGSDEIGDSSSVQEAPADSVLPDETVEQAAVSQEDEISEETPVSEEVQALEESPIEEESTTPQEIHDDFKPEPLPTKPPAVVIGESDEEDDGWEDKNTSGEVPLEEWIDLESIPTNTMPIPTERMERPKDDPQFVSQNWDIAAFLKQKQLFDEANNWLSAWCVRMDNAEKTSYPHYGFIVDLMHDLRDKSQIVLENQLLEDFVDKEIPGGRETVETTLKAVEKEFENLPDDYKTSTAEKIRLNAREILGKLDTSTEKEFIGKAPDGFELMDDPYEASAQQIIDDFEKTEREAQGEIDKLNVIEDNTDNQQKGNEEK